MHTPTANPAMPRAIRRSQTAVMGRATRMRAQLAVKQGKTINRRVFFGPRYEVRLGVRMLPAQEVRQIRAPGTKKKILTKCIQNKSL